jgi:hypothetical protein
MQFGRVDGVTISDMTWPGTSVNTLRQGVSGIILRSYSFTMLARSNQESF